MSLTAQNTNSEPRETIRFGVKVGANYSDVYATKGDNFNPDGKLGFATGLFAQLPLSDRIGLQPEVLYSEKGFKATGEVVGNTYVFTRTNSYIDIPVFLTLELYPFISVLAGPQYSYLINTHNKFTNATSSIDTEKAIDNEDGRKHNFGVVGGFDINIGQFVVGPRIGIDALRNTSEDTPFIPSHKNLWIQATLGYRF